MILEKQTEAHILQEGTSQDTIGMSLDLDSAQVLMQMLSKNLYSDAIGSTIRECASNALDSHRRVESDKPIIVSFKRNNQADTFEFTVEDFGIGLDDNDVVNIISKYGKSTKRNSNTELGMMGLGFKAPLAYSSSFYFVARKDGMERKYMMYEGEDTNSIDLLYEKATDESNGVKVIVPVNYSDRYSFTSKIKEQLAYFENVYFDIDSSWGSVDNNFTIHRAEHFQYSSLATNNDMHLCLDNVSYPIDWEKLGINRIGIKLALRFSLSDGLFPTPNREAIRYTKEAKETILKKIAVVADVFMEKFNENITTNSDINSIIELYTNNSKSIKSWYKGTDDTDVYIDELVKHSTIPIAQPKLEGVELLNLERLAVKANTYILSEYHFKYQFYNGKFQNMKRNQYNYLRLSDLQNSSFAGVYIYNHELSKSKQDYLRTTLPYNKNVFFVKKSPFKLKSKSHTTDYAKYYHSILGLETCPKDQWRQLITEFQHIVSLYSKNFIDADAIEIPQEYKDAQKAKRMKVAISAIKGPKKVRMKGEFSGKVGTAMEVTLSDQYCKFVPTTFKMEDIHNVKKLHVYAKEADKKKMDALWSRGAHLVNFVLVAQATYDNLQKADLHNWITLDKFMEGKNRPFKVIATEFLIRDLIEKKSATFRRIHIVTDISVDLADKLHELKSYDDKNHRSYADRETMKAIILHATENRLFDEPIYTTYKQVCEVFTKLPFLDVLMERMSYRTDDKSMIQAIIDLFKYHKHRVNLEHYKLILTEDAPLEEVLTQDTITELETI